MRIPTLTWNKLCLSPHACMRNVKSYKYTLTRFLYRLNIHLGVVDLCFCLLNYMHLCKQQWTYIQNKPYGAISHVSHSLSLILSACIENIPHVYKRWTVMVYIGNFFISSPLGANTIYVKLLYFGLVFFSFSMYYTHICTRITIACLINFLWAR